MTLAPPDPAGDLSAIVDRRRPAAGQGTTDDDENPIDRVFARSLNRLLLWMAVFALIANVLALTPMAFVIGNSMTSIPSGDAGTVLHLLLLTATAIATLALLTLSRDLIVRRAEAAFDRTTYQTMLVRLAGAPAVTERAIRQATADLDTLRRFYCRSAPDCLYDLFVCVFTVLGSFFINAVMGLYVLACFAVIFALFVKSAGGVRRLDEDFDVATLELARLETAVMRNLDLIRVMGMTTALTERWSARRRTVDRQWQDVRGTSALWTEMLGLAISFLSTFAFAVMTLVETDASLAGMFGLVYMMLMLRSYGAVRGIVQTIEARRVALAARGRADTFFTRLQARRYATLLSPPTGRIMFDAVTYVRANSVQVLKNVSFALAPGASLAVIGANGSGKTTVLKLLLGVLKPARGRATLDGFDLYSWDREALRRHIGYMPQDAEFYEGSIADNISGLEPGLRAAVEAAAARAGATGLIAGLPQGYDTVYLPGTRLLSGGQMQRLALARALYRAPRLLVLDEPTSHLDQPGEREFIEILRQLKREGVTIVLVSHRLSVIREMEYAIWLDRGEVRQAGRCDRVVAAAAAG